MTQRSDPVPLRLVSFNVRFATTNPVAGEEPWSVRRPKVIAQLRFLSLGQANVFFCLQEVLYAQLRDIQAGLGPGWAHIGRGREDGRRAGEHAPVFFRSDVWECEREAMYWLSETPDRPSRGWDAALERVVTTGRFRRRRGGADADAGAGAGAGARPGPGARVTVMSTHLDHRGAVAREQSAKLLLRLARDWAEEALPPAERSVVFVGGDFNSSPDDQAYKTLTSPDGGMRDISGLVPAHLWHGNRDHTYTSFGEPGEAPQKIDFLFVLDPQGIDFVSYGILTNRFDDGVFLSDHRPVVADTALSPRRP